MGKIYRKFCENCGKYYEKKAKRFCSPECWQAYETNKSVYEKGIPIPNIPDYNDFWKLSGDWVVSSDWHIPYYDHKLVDKLIKIANLFKIRKLLIVGDFTDQATFRRILYDIAVVREEIEENLEYTFQITAEIVNELLDNFDEIRLLTGNHDIYFFKILKGSIKKLERFYQLIGISPDKFGKKFFVSNYPFCSLNNKWHITHPKSYSRIPMNVARLLSTKYRMSAISAHGHQFGLSTDLSGIDICCDSGGLFDYKKIAYKWFTDTTHPQWISGFIVIRNNKPYLFSDKITDWDFWFKNVKIRR